MAEGSLGATPADGGEEANPRSVVEVRRACPCVRVLCLLRSDGQV
jgi:hypothetical protein